MADLPHYVKPYLERQDGNQPKGRQGVKEVVDLSLLGLDLSSHRVPAWLLGIGK